MLVLQESSHLVEIQTIFVCQFFGIFEGRTHSDVVAAVHRTVVAQPGRFSLEILVLGNHMMELYAE